jgi:hypothetical protein
MMTVIFGVSKPERMQRVERAMLAYCAVTESPSFLGVGILSTAPRGRWLPILKTGAHRRRGRRDRPRGDRGAPTDGITQRRLLDHVPRTQRAGGAPVVLSARNRTDESAGKMPR